MNETLVGLQILSKANEVALASSKNKNHGEASRLMEVALDYYVIYVFTEPTDEVGLNAAFEDQYLVEYKDSFGLWMGNYGYFLYKSDSLQKSIDVNLKLNQTYPHLSGPYLQRGDALYDQGKKTQAKPVYLHYMKLMKEKGKEKSIPERVSERVK